MYVYFKPKSKMERRLFTCCCCGKSSKKPVKLPTKEESDAVTAANEKQMSSSIDHNSDATDTATTDVQNNEYTKMQYCLSTSDSSCESANSNNSKEYFTIANRFDTAALSSLLNDVIPDDDDDNMIGFGMNNMNTLNKSKTLSKPNHKQTSSGLGLTLPNKSFNCYIKDLNKNSKNASGVSNTNNSINAGKTSVGLLSTNSITNNVNSNLTNGSLLSNGNNSSRYSNYLSSHPTGSIRSASKQRTSFAFSLRTNLDQDI
jgi:hypothetical protein